MPGVDCCDSVVGELTSVCLESVSGLMDFVGGVTVEVVSPAVATATSPANLAGAVTVGVASPVVAGTASLAVAGMASLADAGVAPLADVAEEASSADVAESAAGGTTFLADPVDVVTSELTFWEGCSRCVGLRL